MRKISIALTMVLFCGGAAAWAEEPQGAAVEQRPEPPSSGAGPSRTDPPQPAAAHAINGQQPASAAAKTAHSDPAYAQKLSSAVRARLPAIAGVGPGSASCVFHVTATGSTSGINCHGSSPAHSQLLEKAIAATKAPPPPGGAFSANQSVVYH